VSGGERIEREAGGREGGRRVEGKEGRGEGRGGRWMDGRVHVDR
jgi:hypothetical protein